MNANVTDKAENTTLPFIEKEQEIQEQPIETIANTSVRNMFVYGNKSKKLAYELYKMADIKDRFDKKTKKRIMPTFEDVSAVLDKFFEINIDKTMQLVCYMFCCENEEQLNEKVKGLDVFVPLWQIYNHKDFNLFFTSLFNLGLKVSQGLPTDTTQETSNS